MARAKRLKYHGKEVVQDTGPNGEVIRTGFDRFFFGVPTRDLEEADINALDDATYKNITGTPPGGEPLYTDPDKKSGSDKDGKKEAPKRVRNRSQKKAADKPAEPATDRKAEAPTMVAPAHSQPDAVAERQPEAPHADRA